MENVKDLLLKVKIFKAYKGMYCMWIVQADMEQVQEVQDEDLHQHPPPDLQVYRHT